MLIASAIALASTLPVLMLAFVRASLPPLVLYGFFLAAPLLALSLVARRRRPDVSEEAA